MGLTNRDAEGFRLGPDGKAITFAMTVHPEESQWIPTANIILEELHLIGLKANVRTVDWGGAPQIQKEGGWEIWVAQSCDVQIHRWPESMQCAAPTHEGGSFPGQQPTWAIDWHDWLASDGAKGEEPPDRIKENYAIWQGLKNATGDELAALYRHGRRTAPTTCGWSAPRVAARAVDPAARRARHQSGHRRPSLAGHVVRIEDFVDATRRRPAPRAGLLVSAAFKARTRKPGQAVPWLTIGR